MAWFSERLARRRRSLEGATTRRIMPRVLRPTRIKHDPFTIEQLDQLIRQYPYMRLLRDSQFCTREIKSGIGRKFQMEIWPGLEAPNHRPEPHRWQTGLIDLGYTKDGYLAFIVHGSTRATLVPYEHTLLETIHSLPAAQQDQITHLVLVKVDFPLCWLDVTVLTAHGNIREWLRRP